MNWRQMKIKKIKQSVIDELLEKKSMLNRKEYALHKSNSLKNSIFLGLFFWLIIGVWQKDAIISGAIAAASIAVIFVLLLSVPALRNKKRIGLIEAELPLILMKIASDVQFGKPLVKAIEQAGLEEGEAAKEFKRIGEDMKRGASFEKALEGLNNRIGTLNARRMSAGFSNLQKHGFKDSTAIKKLAEEMLLRQRIETKEFSGKMVLFALVFIAVSAIVPAMFMSFVLIGSFFMSIKFSPLDVLLIGCVGFPLIDAALLMMIEAKTPVFLKS